MNYNIREDISTEFIVLENKVCVCNYAVRPADPAVLYYTNIKHGSVTYLRVSRGQTVT